MGDTPQAPDVTSQVRQGVYASANALPLQKQVDAAALMGQKVTVNGITYDFSGLGEADYQKAYADAMANAMLETQKNLGGQYVDERLKELNLADPSAVDFRNRLYSAITGDAGKTGEGLDKGRAEEQSILDELTKGGELSPEQFQAVHSGVLGQQIANGNWAGNTAATEEAKAVSAASDQVKSDRQARALAWLTSGATPEDVQYRKTQQNEADLASFLNGVTPTAQFQQLSGAQNQAAPFYNVPSGPTINDGSGAVNYASQIYGIQSNYNSGQANPWLSGLSMGFGGIGVAGALGAFGKKMGSGGGWSLGGSGTVQDAGGS